MRMPWTKDDADPEPDDGDLMFADEDGAFAPGRDTGEDAATRWLFDAAFPSACAQVRDGTLTRAQIDEIVAELIRSRYPEAAAVFGFGSAFADGGDRFGAYSDIDLLVALPKGMFVRNRCMMARGVPVEVHVFGLEAADRLIGYARRSGNASVLLPVAIGEVLYDPHFIADEVKLRFTAAYEAGPNAAAKPAIDSQRWMATTQLADLATNPNPAERKAAALAAYNPLVRLLFLDARGWLSRGKWAVRNGDAIVAGLSGRLEEGYRQLFAGDDPAAFLKVALEILDRAGGPLWSGHVEAMNLPG